MAWVGAEVKQYTPSIHIVGAPARDRYVVVDDRDTANFAVFDVQTGTSRQFTGIGVTGYQMSTSSDNQYVWHAGQTLPTVGGGRNLRLSRINPVTGETVYWTGPAVYVGTSGLCGCVDTGNLVWIWHMTTAHNTWNLIAFDKTTEMMVVVDTLVGFVGGSPLFRPSIWHHAGVVYWTDTNRRYNAATTAALSPTANMVPSPRSIGPWQQPGPDGIAWWRADFSTTPIGGHTTGQGIVGWDLPGNQPVHVVPLSTYPDLQSGSPSRLGDYVYQAVNGNLLAVYNINTGILATQTLPANRAGRIGTYLVDGKLVIPSSEPSSW